MAKHRRRTQEVQRHIHDVPYKEIVDIVPIASPNRLSFEGTNPPPRS